MSSASDNNKRIAKNTLFLYFRMILTMSVSLYTIKIVLNTLGISDYGIYNVVGGIVTMFSFLSGTMASASQRFFAFELGRKDYVRLKQTFSLTFIIYVGIAVIIVLLAETAGLWFLNTQMNIPSERMSAANWVYQFSVFSFIMTVLTVPYNAAIIAREKMSVYAYVSIVDVVLKLLIVYFLVLFSFDTLKLYAVLTFAVTTVVTFIYRTYCKRKFEECKFSFYWDRQLLCSLFSYSGWNIIGVIAGIVKGQGINLLLNIFFGPLLNAAYAVANQVHSVLAQFVTNIYSATRPQITKYYAENDMKPMWNLVFDSTKFSYYLFLLILVPFLFEIEYILTLWLGQVPEHTPTIVRLVLCGFMIETVSGQLVAVLQAANKLKKIQLFSVPVLFLNLPVSYVLLKWGYSPYMPFVVLILVNILYMTTKILVVKKEVNLSMKRYLTEILKLMRTTLLAVLLPCTVYTILPSGIIRCVCILMVLLLSLALSVWHVGLSKDERSVVIRICIRKYISYVKK